MPDITLQHVNIRGISSCVPRQRVVSSAFLDRFSQEEVAKFESISGVRERRVVDTETTAQLCYQAARELLKSLDWSPESVDVLVLVTQTPDYLLPASSCIVQNKLGMRSDTIAFDVSLGCSGFVYGQYILSSFLASSGLKRALLLAGDTISRLLDPADKSTAMLFGDAGTAMALEYGEDASPIYFSLGTDGGGHHHIMVPRSPVYSTVGDFHLCMSGSEVFNFTLTRVYSELSKFIAKNNIMPASNFVFHQANEFILKQLARKLKIPNEFLCVNIDRFGNTSSASIPLALCTEFDNERFQGDVTCVGFGVGLSWGFSHFKIDKNIPLFVTEYAS